MPKYFREVNKHFSGDKTLAVRYMGVARSLLGGLVEMSGDVFQNVRHVTLPDGTKISVSFAGAVANVSINVEATEDSDKNDRFNVIVETAGITVSEVDGVVRHLPTHVTSYIGNDQVSVKLLDKVVLEKSGTSVAIVGSVYSSDAVKSSIIHATSDEFTEYRQSVVETVKASHFTGKTRLLIQALLGSKPERIGVVVELYAMSPTSKTVYIDGVVAVNESTGIYTSPTGAYWLVTPQKSGGSYSVSELKFGELAGAFTSAIEEATDDAEITRLETYKFSLIETADMVASSHAMASISGEPVAWGWHFDWAGERAVMVALDDSDEYAETKAYDCRLVVSGDTPVCDLTVSDYSFIPDRTRFRLFFPSLSGVMKYAFVNHGLPADASGIPLYAFYKQTGELVLYDYSYTDTTTPIVEGAARTLYVCGEGSDTNLVKTFASGKTMLSVGSVTSESHAGVSTVFRELDVFANSYAGSKFLGWSLYDSLGMSLCSGGPLDYETPTTWYGADVDYQLLSLKFSAYTYTISSKESFVTLLVPYDSCTAGYVLHRYSEDGWSSTNNAYYFDHGPTFDRGYLVNLVVLTGYKNNQSDAAVPQPNGLGSWSTWIVSTSLPPGGVTTAEYVEQPDTTTTFVYLDTSIESLTFDGPDPLDDFFFRSDPGLESRSPFVLDSVMNDYVYAYGSLTSQQVNSGSGYSELPINFTGWA